MNNDAVNLIIYVLSAKAFNCDSNCLIWTRLDLIDNIMRL